MNSVRHNLPTRLTPLIGREVETTTVMDLLAGDRLVTLVGTGGVGKSRLALNVAARSLDGFEGGVWWVDLAPLSEPGSIPEAVLNAAGIAHRSGRDVVGMLGSVIRDRPAMFVLDNCEHLVDACAVFVDAVLTASSEMVFLATSREPLGVASEIVWRVPSLPVPDPFEIDTADAIEQSDACRLFLERARRARPGVEVDHEVAASVAEICRQVDGIPLAIELAAARCRNLSVERIREELADRFRLLTGGVRTAHARQQTLRASIDWSHDLLEPHEQAALRRLGVFAGSFPIEAAEAVLSYFGDIHEVDVLDLLDRLADKSLITTDDLTTDGSRYRLLDTIRDYAVERLHERGEIASARDAHATYWATWSTDHNLYVDIGPETEASVHANLADLVVATRWACGGRPDLLASLIESVGLCLSPENDGVFTAAMAALDGVDETAWTQVASAAYLAITFTKVINPSDEFSDRARIMADELGLKSAQARFAYIDAVFGGSPEMYDTACELYREAGALTWAAHSSAVGARFLVSRGQVDSSDEFMYRANEMATPSFLERAGLGWRCQRALVLGELTGVAAAEREALEDRQWSTQSVSGSDIWTNRYSPESLGRVAFFSEDVAVLDWVVEKLECAPTEWPSIKRAGDLAAAHAILLRDGPTAASLARDRIRSSALGPGLIGRETPYLAIAGADPDWLCDEREAIQRHAEGDVRVQAFTHLCDAMLAWYTDDNAKAEDRFHELLAVASEHSFGLLWIDALEGLALCAARAGGKEEAGRLAGAAAAARVERGYRYRYPHLSDLPEGSEEGRRLSLDEATAYAQRARGRRDRPATGWAALTSTEVEVAKVVAEGLTNKAAAERLFMSVPTVKTHLRHIFAKLEIENRSQLTSVVAERDAQH
jgi:predicted ATPase/DNA-binding CsgD family transcriptional regulator